MPQNCRLCLKSLKSFSADLTDHREGFPLSVIAMIILPVKISLDDNLPQKICSSCLEILLKAFQLRETSLESDRKLRLDQTPQNSELCSIVIKSEQIEEVSNFFREESPEWNLVPSPDKSKTFAASLDSTHPPSRDEIYSDDLRVELHPKVRGKKSEVWNFFGFLKDGNGEPAGSKFYNYCALCLKNKTFTKYRATTATGSLRVHLENMHGFRGNGNFNEASEEPPAAKKMKIQKGNEILDDFTEADFDSEAGSEDTATA